MLSGLDFDDFFNLNRSKKKQKVIELTEEEYKQLKEKAESYNELTKNYKVLEEKVKNLIANEKDLLKLKEKAELADKYLNSLARLQAEFENYKKFTERENEKFKKFALKNILSELIKLNDDLERALNAANGKKDFQSLHQGLQMILNNLKKLLECEGVKQIDAKGEIFDPSKHHVCMVEQIKDSNDIPEDTILEEIEKGYYYKDQLLRPSMVKIAKIVSK
ncbi:MAG: nucleotide exchange factor GrpE [Promethearchaeota archaeon]